MFRDVEGRVMCLYVYKLKQRKNQYQSFEHYGKTVYHLLTYVQVVKYFSSIMRNEESFHTPNNYN